MNKLEGYFAGVNLGGWISQYSKYDHNHFKTFITKKDIEQIASWGMDHVRLPIDYAILEDDDKPFIYKEEGFQYIDNCIKWCKEYGLNIILDLHKAPGYSFGTLNENTFFDDKRLQERFISLWRAFAVRYIGQKDTIIFELLNEIVEPTSDRWNKVAHETVAAIRELDKDRRIIVGGNLYNSVFMLKEIELFDDENVIYTFHFYEPHLFTHQKASWMPTFVEFNKTVNYPDSGEVYSEFHKRYPDFPQTDLALLDLEEVGEAYIRQSLKPAIEFVKSTGKAVYCGEYGVIAQAPAASKIRWHQYVIAAFKELNIARSVWSYKEMGFPMVDISGKVIDEELIKVVSSK
ncbi:MAG TPA: cellulase family glycosylhydrolase [Clostridiaceae bacterium]